jgi:hypothetical protein
MDELVRRREIRSPRLVTVDEIEMNMEEGEGGHYGKIFSGEGSAGLVHYL